jgi:hypothetical protein
MYFGHTRSFRVTVVAALVVRSRRAHRRSRRGDSHGRQSNHYLVHRGALLHGISSTPAHAKVTGRFSSGFDARHSVERPNLTFLPGAPRSPCHHHPDGRGRRTREGLGWQRAPPALALRHADSLRPSPGDSPVQAAHLRHLGQHDERHGGLVLARHLARLAGLGLVEPPVGERKTRRRRRNAWPILLSPCCSAPGRPSLPLDSRDDHPQQR